MKSYVITIMDLKQSRKTAQRCINSVKNHKVEMFDAVTPKDNPLRELELKGIPIEGFNEIYSKLENCVSAFLSHHTLWEMCVADNQEYMIFEHDAVAIDTIPEFIAYDKMISLGKPSYGKFLVPERLGVNPLTSKPYFPGAHAYRLKPSAAKILIDTATKEPMPTDVYLNRNRFPFLQEYYPWPVEAKDSFTTIQKEKGCLAKHNYREGYEILTK